MAVKSDLHYRWEDDCVVVKKNKGNKLKFQNAKAAYHKDGNIFVISSLGRKIRVDKFGIRHWE